MNAVMTALFDALKYYSPDDDKDDWGESRGFWAKAGMNWVNDMLDGLNPLANIPYIKDAWELMNGGKVERMDMANVSKLVQAATKAWKFAAEGNPQHLTAWAALKPMLTGAADIMGLPVSGLVADAEFAINGARNIMGKGAMSGKLPTATLDGAYEALYQAMASGNTARARQLRQDIMKDRDKDATTIDKELAKKLALHDDRIRQCWEIRESGKTKGLVQLKKEIMADGFSEAVVVAAINRYASTIKSDAKKGYLLAVEKGNEAKREEYAEKLKSVGVTQDVMDKWTAETETKEDEGLALSGLYTKANLWTAIRGGEATDAEIKDIVESLQKYSEAEDPMSGIRSGLTTEFRQEYIELIRSGKTSQAAKLRKRLEAAGAKPETIDKWEKDAKK